MRTQGGVPREDSAVPGPPACRPAAGRADVRLTVGAVPSRRRHAGLRYRRLLSETTDGPLLRDRGARDRLHVGCGIGCSW
jgi:hypothetical protein